VSAYNLTAEELRVLACLIEKSHTTPDQYPLSTNGLVTACNQRTSREPVVEYPAQLVDRVMQLLRDGGWARTVMASGSRVAKHRHVVDERLGLDTPRLAVLAVLALRGPQSAGELKTRTERYHPFADAVEVEEVLHGLANRDEPLVRNVGRGPGQSHDRWAQLVGPLPGETEPGGGASSPAEQQGLPSPADTPRETDRPPAHAVPAGAPAAPTAVLAESAGESARSAATSPEVRALQDRVTALEQRLADLERELGLDG
jgi:uncharacterized protein YceH (UPF0502 family)